MKAGGRVVKPVTALAALMFVLAACLPFPPVIRGPELTPGGFTPGASRSQDAMTRLQPTLAPRTPGRTPTDAPSDALPQVAPLHGALWQWKASSFSDGSALAPSRPARYTVEFLPDGNALVQADCNFGAGMYRAEGDALTIGAIGATKMACAADSLASAFLAQLANVAGFAVEGDELALTLKDGAGEMRLAASRPPATAIPSASPTAIAATATATAEPTATATALPTPTTTPTATQQPTVTPVPPTPGPMATPVFVELNGAS
jgi:heat shock protein HslJ